MNINELYQNLTVFNNDPQLRKDCSNTPILPKTIRANDKEINKQLTFKLIPQNMIRENTKNNNYQTIHNLNRQIRHKMYVTPNNYPSMSMNTNTTASTSLYNDLKPRQRVLQNMINNSSHNNLQNMINNSSHNNLQNMINNSSRNNLQNMINNGSRNNLQNGSHNNLQNMTNNGSRIVTQYVFQNVPRYVFQNVPQYVPNNHTPQQYNILHHVPITQQQHQQHIHNVLVSQSLPRPLKIQSPNNTNKHSNNYYHAQPTTNRKESFNEKGQHYRILTYTETDVEVMKKYFGIHYKEIASMHYFNDIISTYKNVAYMRFIVNNKDKKLNYLLNIKESTNNDKLSPSPLSMIYKLLIQNPIIQMFKRGTVEEAKRALDLFDPNNNVTSTKCNKIVSYIIRDVFNYNTHKPEIIKKIKELFSKHLDSSVRDKGETIGNIIRFQYIFLRHFDKFIHDIVKYSDKDIHVEISSSLSSENDKQYNEDPGVKTFIEKYMEEYKDVKKLSTTNIYYRHKPELEEKDLIIYNILEQILQNIIIRTQIVKNKYPDKFNFGTVIYGSYTSYTINPKIKYNDIDIYHTNPNNFLITMILFFDIFMNINVSVNRIPFIIGHLSLTYQDKHFTDCIYIDSYTMNRIPQIKIDNISFISPILQMINNFRMMSEIARMSSINNNYENSVKKYCALLSYENDNLRIDYNNLLKIVFDPVIIEEKFILFNLNTTFNKELRKKGIKTSQTFDYLIVCLYDANAFLELLNRQDVKISKQFGAFFNEIGAEFLNRVDDNILPLKKGEQTMIEIEQTKRNRKNKKGGNSLGIQETFIPLQPNQHINTYPSEVLNIIENNNVLLMSALTTNTYCKSYCNSDNILEKTELTNISKETVFSSFVLYNLLKFPDSSVLNKFYIEALFGFINDNDKSEELKLLASITDNQDKVSSKNYNLTFNEIYKVKKYKNKGDHSVFNYQKLFCKDLFFYHNQPQEYYTYEEFTKTSFYK